jgi:hypothetical protein
MKSYSKHLFFGSLFFLIAGMLFSAYGLEEGVDENQQSKPAQRKLFVTRDDRGKKDREYEKRGYRDRDRGGDFGFSGGNPYDGFNPAYGNYYNYPPNGYPQAFDSIYDVGYREGFDAGQSDHLNGFIYNPRQYERGGNSDYFEGFVAGYRDGWNR